jgi:cyclic dehypoxanthinyl futalosine synthase
MQLPQIYARALALQPISGPEALFLYHNAPLHELAWVANTLRQHHKQDTPGIVTWQIDRNVNTTNVCIANCKFCNFFRPPGHPESYITPDDVYRRKIEETFALGGDQLLLQGGHHPDLGIEYYEELFRKLKSWYPNLKLHSLGPPEIDHIAKLSGLDYASVLARLQAAGLDSLPGAGAEILSDRVRRLISNGKCKTQPWLDVMRAAHQLRITTSATMMFGHVETLEERIEHLLLIRQVQAEKPADAKGFLAFIPWPYQDDGTVLTRVKGVRNEVTPAEYVRMLALCRIVLHNIPNIQASWLTVGPKVAQMCLHAGANDLGCFMIVENVVSAAGAPHRFSAEGIQQCIREAGFTPQLRTQQYEFRPWPVVPQPVLA